jgi:hypothetical protein
MQPSCGDDDDDNLCDRIMGRVDRSSCSQAKMRRKIQVEGKNLAHGGEATR